MPSCSRPSYNGKAHKAKYAILTAQDESVIYLCGMHLQSVLAIELEKKRRNGGAQYVVVSLVENEREI